MVQPVHCQHEKSSKMRHLTAPSSPNFRLPMMAVAYGSSKTVACRKQVHIVWCCPLQSASCFQPYQHWVSYSERLHAEALPAHRPHPSARSSFAALIYHMGNAVCIPASCRVRESVHNRLQDHLIMALPSSSTLCLVLVLMPTAHSVSCTPMLMSSPSKLNLPPPLCSLAVSDTYYTSRVLTQCPKAFAYARTGDEHMCEP